MTKRKFKKVLVANRGEITVRVMRTLREMGISPVAIFSEADRLALHVRMADEAVCVGPAPARESYLRKDAVLEAAQRMGVDAVHPGYGFLSEDAEFATALEDAGIVLIGPSAASMRMMGSKTRAREAMTKAGVPCVPGSDGALDSEAEITKWAAKIGYPVMLKASAGGGGKGMRLVHESGDVLNAFRAAQSEALNAFGDPAVYMEKAVMQPRHIEIQILGGA